MRFVWRHFEIDDDCFAVRCRGASVHVEPRVLEVMIYLLRNRQRVVSKGELRERVWCGSTVGGSAIDRSVCLVRKTLAEPTVIRTVYARGYQWTAPIDILHGP